MVNRVSTRTATLIVAPVILISPWLGIALAKSHAFGPNPQTFFGLGVFTGAIIVGSIWSVVATWPFGAESSKSVD